MYFATYAEEQKKAVQMGNVVADDEDRSVRWYGPGFYDFKAIEKLI